MAVAHTLFSQPRGRCTSGQARLPESARTTLIFLHATPRTRPPPSVTTNHTHTMGAAFDFAPERPEHIQTILDGLDRYNPETTATFQDYVMAQCESQTYDCYANLALLKLYVAFRQFCPHYWLFLYRLLRLRDEQLTTTFPITRGTRRLNPSPTEVLSY
jgi:hypothetical protein